MPDRGTSSVTRVVPPFRSSRGAVLQPHLETAELLADTNT